jgi:hypothetical protein
VSAVRDNPHARPLRDRPIKRRRKGPRYHIQITALEKWEDLTRRSRRFRVLEPYPFLGEEALSFRDVQRSIRQKAAISKFHNVERSRV